MADNTEETTQPEAKSTRMSLPAQIRNAANDVRKDTIVTSANLYLVARRVLLTSLGAIALTIEETNEFIDKLVERGELAEHELSHLVEDFTARNRAANARALLDKDASATGEEGAPAPRSLVDTAAPTPPNDGAALVKIKGSGREAGSAASFPVTALADRVEVILDRLNVPTRTDIEELSAKIARLSDKVAQMKSRSSVPVDSLKVDPLRTNGSHAKVNEDKVISDKVIDIVGKGENSVKGLD